MPSVEEIREELLRLLQNGVYAELGTPLFNTEPNGYFINQQMARLVMGAINDGDVYVDLDDRVIYIPLGDEYLNILPCVPLVYPSMMNTEFDVTMRGVGSVCRVYYGQYAKQTSNDAFIVGVDTTLKFNEPLQSITMEVKLDDRTK